jgi:hypothetical protein
MELMGSRTVEKVESYPLISLKAKLGDLWRELSKPENAGHRQMLAEVHHALSLVASDRNVAFHGLWALWLDRPRGSWRIASKSYTRKDPFFAESLPQFHERVVSASVLLDVAWWTLLGGEGAATQDRNKRQCFSDDGMIGFDDPPPPPVRTR